MRGLFGAQDYEWRILLLKSLSRASYTGKVSSPTLLDIDQAMLAQRCED